MEWLEPLAGLGALGICAVVLLVVSKSVMTRASETASLLNLMHRQIDQAEARDKQIKDLVQELVLLRRDENKRESRAQERHEKIIEVLEKMLGNDTTIIKLATDSATLQAQLVNKIDEVKQTMTDHDNKTPTYQDLLDAIERVDAKVTNIEIQAGHITTELQQVKTDLSAVKSTAQVVRETQENEVIKVEPSLQRKPMVDETPKSRKAEPNQESKESKS
jgi:predicted  nucleic acid-binding Zn-ribbon protein